MPGFAGIGGIILTVVTISTTMFKSYTYVPQGSLGLKFRFGKALYRKGQPVIIQPGFVWLIPFIDRVRHQHVVQCGAQTDVRELRFSDCSVYNMQAYLAYSVDKVRGVVFALCEVDNFEERIAAHFGGVVTEACEDLQRPLLSSELTTRIHTRAQDVLDQFGINVISVSLPHYGPTWVTQMFEMGMLGGERSAIPLPGGGAIASITHLHSVPPQEA